MLGDFEASQRSVPLSPESKHSIALRALDEAWSQFPIHQMPEIVWRPYRVCAGRADYVQNQVLLSRIVLNNEMDIRETVLHEYAHLLAIFRLGRRGVGHGAGWRQAMTDLGLAPKVTHQMPVVRNQKRQIVVYRCRKCGTEILRRRKLPNRPYWHIGCRGRIQYFETHSLASE